MSQSASPGWKGSCTSLLVVFVEFLVLVAFGVPAAPVIEELAQGVREHLEDADKEKGHHNPLRNLREKGFLDDLAKAEAEDEHYDRDDDGGPDGETLHKCSLVHITCRYCCFP